MEFEWDEGNRDKSLIRRNISDGEIEEALEDPHGFVVDHRREGGEERHIYLGRSRMSGRSVGILESFIHNVTAKER